MKRFCVFLIAMVAFALTACGGSSTENINHYGVETAQSTTITVATTDQFGNSVFGRILLNGETLDTGELELTYDPAEGGELTFGELPGYTTPTAVDLASSNFADGQQIEAAYKRTGSIANVCPRALNDQGIQIEMAMSINWLPVDNKTGCQSVDTVSDTDITGGDPFFIPADTLNAGDTYHYDLLFGNSSKYVWVATTPVSGQIFIDGRSVGWVKDSFLSVRIPMEGESTLSFGEVPGHETAKSITVSSEDWTYENSHQWALYDPSVNALACFSGVQSGGSSFAGRVLVDDTETIDTEYQYPGCIGLDASLTHTAEFLERDDYQSTDVLSIDAINHVGCEGDFIPGGRLDCVGTYYWVEPAKDRTEFYVRLQFIGPYKGDMEYPISGRYERNGIQYQQDSWGEVLKLSEQVTLTLLPVGILQPNQASVTIDTSELSENDATYDPEQNQWVYTVAYIPPVGATEACVVSWNQNLVNISSEVSVDFDGVQALNSSEEDEDCHWLSASGNHVVVPKNWLSGYQTAVNEIHVPEGKVAQQSHFDMLYIPTPTYHQLCVSGVTVEAGITLNGYFLGWTNFGEVCVRMDKSVPNTLTIEGMGSRSYAADDPALAGTYSTIAFQDF